MDSLTTPLSSAAFLALLGITATVHLSGGVPQNPDLLGVLATAAQHATALRTGNDELLPPSELEAIRADPKRFLSEVCAQPKYTVGHMDMFLAPHGIPVRLHIVHTVRGTLELTAFC